MKTSDGVELKVGMKVTATVTGVQKALAAMTGMSVEQMLTAAKGDAGMAALIAESQKTAVREPMTVKLLHLDKNKATVQSDQSSPMVMDAGDLVSVSGAALAPAAQTSNSWLTKKVDLPIVGPVPRWGVGLGGAAVVALIVALVRR